jgi:hypothetical protein
MTLSLLEPLERTGFQAALSDLKVAQPEDRYTDEQLRLILVILGALGIGRMAHVDDQPIEPLGVLLDSGRRPCSDTLDQYLDTIIEHDSVKDEAVDSECVPGHVRPDGLIENAQLQSLVNWADAGLLSEDVWHYDGHVIEYTGQADIGKTKHGTKNKNVKAVKRFTLYNGLAAYNAYFSDDTTFAEAMQSMVAKANAVLPSAYRIRKLVFDREGWDADLLCHLETEHNIIPLTWVKATAPNRRLLDEVPQDEFVSLEGEITIGKDEQKVQVTQVADTQVSFPQLGPRRVVILQTQEGTRIGLYNTALRPAETTLDDERAMSTLALLNAMRFQQRIENGFKVDKHEMAADAIPNYSIHEVLHTEPYDCRQAQANLTRAEKRLGQYANQAEDYKRLLAEGRIDKHEFNTLSRRNQRLRLKTDRAIADLQSDLDSVQFDDKGQAVRSYITQILDVRKLTLLNLFKTHALVSLSLVAEFMGLPGTGPARLRREFLAFGDRVEFDDQQRTVTVYPQRFPRGRIRQAYERLCAELNNRHVTLQHAGIDYRVIFSW